MILIISVWDTAALHTPDTALITLVGMAHHGLCGTHDTPPAKFEVEVHAAVVVAAVSFEVGVVVTVVSFEVVAAVCCC